MGLRRKASVTSLPSPPCLWAARGRGAREWGKWDLALVLPLPSSFPRGIDDLPGEVEQGGDSQKDMF